jgi:hypothetical protein
MAVIDMGMGGQELPVPSSEWSNVAFLRKLRLFRLLIVARYLSPFIIVGLMVAPEFWTSGISWGLVLGAPLVLILLHWAAGFAFFPFIAVVKHAIKRSLRARQRAIPAKLVETVVWGAPDPGSLALTEAGDLVLITRNHAFSESFIRPEQVVSAKVERKLNRVTRTEHSGSLTLGGLSGSGWFGAVNSGSTSKSVTQEIEDITLEVQAQPERGRPVDTFVVPFGTDRRSAEELCLLINQFRQAA